MEPKSIASGNLVEGPPFWHKENNLVLLVLSCCLLLGSDVSSCSCEWGRRVGRGRGWGGGCHRRCERFARTRTHTCQCTQIDAWPMSQCWLQMLAKGVWRVTNVHSSKHESARRASVTRARKRPRLLHSEDSMYGHRVAIIARLYHNPCFTLMCFATCMACLEASASH